MLALVAGAAGILARDGGTRAWIGASPQDFAHSSTTRRPGPIVVVGVGGLSWNDVSQRATPHLWSLLSQGASAAVSVRAVHDNTCPLDGWLSLSAGGTAGQPGSAAAPPCAPLPALVGPAGPRGGFGAVRVAGWSDLLRAALGRSVGAQPGLLGQSMQAAHRCIQAIGPGAGLAAASTAGAVARYQPYSAAAVGNVDLAACPVTVLDIGAIRSAGPGSAIDAVDAGASRSTQVRVADIRVGQILARAPSNADVLIFGLADSGTGPYLRLLSLRGPYVAPGLLRSDSTRQRGLVQSADVTATILTHAGRPIPDAVSGSVLQVLPDHDVVTAITPQAAMHRLQGLRDLGEAAHQVRPLVEPFFLMWVGLQLLAYGLLWWRWRTALPGSARRRLVASSVGRVATAGSAVPAASFLANLLPWWRSSVPFLTVTAAVALFTAAICVLAWVGPWCRRATWPIGVVCAATLAVITTDLMTGSRLQLSSLMGLQPLIGGRYYGMGNVTFALYATAALVLALILAGPASHAGARRSAAATVLVIGVGVLAVDAAPMWGADFGGPPALLPALAYLALAAALVRLTWRRLVAIVLVTVGFVAAVCIADWLRPPQSRTHLGRFVQSVIDGDAGPIVTRKLDQNLAFVVSTPLTVIIPIALVVTLYALARPHAWPGRYLSVFVDRVPLLRAGLVALAICLVVGFALNDSGAAIPAVSGTMILPMLVAFGARTGPEGRRARSPRSADSAAADRGPVTRRRPWSGRI